MAKNTVKLIVENYKKIENFEQEFSSGCLYFVRGGNEQGKTSFINNIKDILTAQSTAKNPVTFGKESGTSVLQFLGGDGQQYSIRVDYDKDGKAEFSITYPNMDRSKKVSDIRSWAKFNPFTVDEWMAWSLTAEGRRKQTEIVQQFIPEELQKELADIEAKINAKNGTIYKLRTEAGKALDTAKSVLQSFTITPEEQKAIEYYGASVEALELLEKQKSELEKIKNQKESKDELAKTKLQNLNDAKEERVNKDREFEDGLKSCDTQIKELEERIKALKESKKKGQEQWNEYKIKNDEKIKTLTAELEAPKEENIDVEKQLAEIATKISAGKEFVIKGKLANEKKENLKKARETAEQAQKDYDKYHGEIEDARIRKTTIYSESKLPVDNIEIIEGETFLRIGDNFVPFTESDISYSTAGKIVAKILAKLNKNTGIILLGKSAEYDKKSLDELAKIAEEENCFMFCDYVMDDGAELEVVVHEK